MAWEGIPSPKIERAALERLRLRLLRALNEWAHDEPAFKGGELGWALREHGDDLRIDFCSPGEPGRGDFPYSVIVTKVPGEDR